MTWLRLALPVAALLPTIVLGACDARDEIEGEEELLESEQEQEEAEEQDPQGEGAEQKDPPAPKPEAAIPCEHDEWGGLACTTASGEEGTNHCILIDGDEFYTPCLVGGSECDPGEGTDMGCLGEICYWDGEALTWYSWSEPDCATPLVVNFDRTPIEFSPAVAASFDLSSDGSCASTDWPTAPWLALDRDGDGFIRDGGELFGSATPMSSGGYAPNGFAGLAELDSNRDGRISAADERFDELVLWRDLDDDRIGAYGELQPLRDTTLISIDLHYQRDAMCDGQGNCGYERVSFEYRVADGARAFGEVVDVYLACR